MDVGKEREQERKLFRHSDCRKHPFSLSLKPAYSGLHPIHSHIHTNKPMSNNEL
jgi:hypothetical protein